MNDDEAQGAPTRSQALRVARLIGCSGAHEGKNGWMPCATHEDMQAALKKHRRKRFERLRERGVRGIETMPGGGMVSAKQLGQSSLDVLMIKVRDHNVNGVWPTTMPSVVTVFQRGIQFGDPSQAMGRVSTFFKVLNQDRPDDVSYAMDADLLPDGHPWRVESKVMREQSFELKRLGGNPRRSAQRFIRRNLQSPRVPYKRDAVDGNGNGIVQEGTPWERPANPARAAADTVKRVANKFTTRRRKRRKEESTDWSAEVRKLNEKDGGFTLKMGGIKSMKSGWAIARDGKGIAIPRSTMFDKDGEPTEEGIDIIAAFVDQHADLLFGAEDTKDRKVTLGAWHNPDTGMLHIDVTDVFSKESMSQEKAIELGKNQNQISIADLDKVAAGDFETAFHNSNGTGGNIIDLSTYNDYIAARRGPDDKRPLRPSLQTRVEEGPENIDMILAEPIADLAERHGETKDWHDIVAVDSDRRKGIADFYDDADDVPAAQMNANARKAYKALAEETEKQFDMLVKELKVNIEFVDEDPYENFLEMRQDFLENRRLKVMRTAVTGSHPFLTDEQNDKFRAVHDAFGHLAAGRGFDRHGEEAAYQAHRTMFSEDAVKALATETRGQNMFLIERGFFGPQKLILLPDEMQKSLRAWMRALTKVARKDSRKAERDSDADNAYTVTRSHHVTGGRVRSTPSN